MPSMGEYNLVKPRLTFAASNAAFAASTVALAACIWALPASTCDVATFTWAFAEILFCTALSRSCSVFVNVKNDMTIDREEIFGPVLSVIAYEDEEDAVRIANDTEFGLHAYVSGTDRERARG